MTARGLGHTLLLVLAAGFAAGGLAGCAGEGQEAVETSAAVPVEVAQVERGPIHQLISATGTVKPAPGAELVVTPPQPARIAALPRGIGDRVRRGELLVRFEIPSLDADAGARHADVQRAAARLAQARASSDRLQGLFERGIAARREVDDAERELAEASAGVAEAESAEAAATMLRARSTVLAPFDGIVAERHHSPGDQVEPSAEPVLRFIDPTRLEIEAALPADQVSRVAEGRLAKVRSPAGATESARLLGLPATLDPATMSAPVRLGFLSPTHLASGTPVEVEIFGEEHRDALLVPTAAVVQEGPDSFVYTVDDDRRVHRQKVEIGVSDDSRVEILAGLSAGMAVVVQGQNGLPDGATVVLPSATATAGGQ